MTSSEVDPRPNGGCFGEAQIHCNVRNEIASAKGHLEPCNFIGIDLDYETNSEMEWAVLQ